MREIAVPMDSLGFCHSIPLEHKLPELVYLKHNQIFILYSSQQVGFACSPLTSSLKSTSELTSRYLDLYLFQLHPCPLSQLFQKVSKLGVH